MWVVRVFAAYTAAVPFFPVDQASNAFPYDLSEGLLPAMRHHYLNRGGAHSNGICVPPVPALVPDPGHVLKCLRLCAGTRPPILTQRTTWRTLSAAVPTFPFSTAAFLLVRVGTPPGWVIQSNPAWSRFEPVVVPSLPRAAKLRRVSFPAAVL